MKIILFIIDCWRADRLDYGLKRGNTPHITRLARKGVVFPMTVTGADSTDPSIASIMTSSYSPVHGLTRNALQLNTDIPTLAHILKDNSYRTVAAVSVEHLSSYFGFGRGFKTYYNNSTFDAIYHRAIGAKIFGFPVSALLGFIRKRIPTLVSHWRNGAATNRVILPWLTTHGNDDFFTWIHYFDLHSCHTVEEYNSKLAFVDTRIGEIVRLLEKLRLLQDTLIIMTGDHGESFGEHGQYGHGNSTLFDQDIVVPLIFHSPASLSHRVLNNQVRTIDIGPTILDFCGLSIPGAWQGESLLPFIRGERAPEHLPALCYSSHFSPLSFAHSHTPSWEIKAKCLRANKWKFIRVKGEPDKLFNLEMDPLESKNEASEEPEELRKIKALFFDLEGFGQVSRTEEEDDKVVIEMLKSLGYME